MTDQEVLVRVTSKFFTAGLTIFAGTCVTASPILSWCKGKTDTELRAYFKAAGWTATIAKSPIDVKVTLTRDGLLSATADERKQLEALFGKPMIQSIVGGNAGAFEGEWTITTPK